MSSSPLLLVFLVTSHVHKSSDRGDEEVRKLQGEVDNPWQRGECSVGGQAVVINGEGSPRAPEGGHRESGHGRG